MTGSLGSFSQLFSPEVPVSWRTPVSALDLFPTEALPPVNLEALFAEDLATANDKSQPFRYAFKHSVSISINEDGRWKSLPNGDRIWRIGISSEGALALNVTFSEFYLARGASLYIYNDDRTEVLGALTSENNKPGRTLGTTPLSGDKIIIELYEPLKSRGLNSITVRSVGHIYRNYNVDGKSFGVSQICNLDAECSDLLYSDEVSSSVVLLSVDDGTRWANGTMVNNTLEDGRPLLLTASQSLIGDPESWVIYFNLLSTGCSDDSDKNPPLGRSLAGAKLLASSNELNFALLELFQLPPYAWNIHLAGWERSIGNVNEAGVLHHPGGDVKKFALAQSIQQNDQKTYSVEWVEGTTEKGSVGSPLLKNNSKVIGWMIGGQSDCQEGRDFFFNLGSAWNGVVPEERLRDWLDPENTDSFQADRLFPEDAYVNDFSTEDNLILYPIPANNELQTFYLGSGELKRLSLLDLSGRMVRNWTNEGSLFIGDLPRGSYIFLLESDNEVLTRKVILD